MQPDSTKDKNGLHSSLNRSNSGSGSGGIVMPDDIEMQNMHTGRQLVRG